MNSLQYKDLLINFTTEFVPVWNDKGTRAEKPVTFWRPSTSSDALGNFVPLGDVAVAGYHNINQLNIVAVVSEVDRENGTALRPPSTSRESGNTRDQGHAPISQSGGPPLQKVMWRWGWSVASVTTNHHAIPSAVSEKTW